MSMSAMSPMSMTVRGAIDAGADEIGINTWVRNGTHFSVAPSSDVSTANPVVAVDFSRVLGREPGPPQLGQMVFCSGLHGIAG